MKLHLQVSTAVLLALVSAAPALSQTKDTKPDSGSISETVNPDKLNPRFFFRNEFRQRKDGTYTNVIEPLYDLPLTDNLVLRTHVPYVTNNPPDAPSTNGLGDITNVLFYRYYHGGGTSHFAGLEARWDTAAKSTLGGGKTLLAPTWFAAINLPEYDTILFPLVQTFFTVDGDDTRPDISYTVLKGRFLTNLENRYYLFAEPLIYFDHEDSNDSTGTLEIEVGRFLNKQTMLYARPGAGLWGNTGSPYLYEWNFEVGYRYFFR